MQHLAIAALSLLFNAEAPQPALQAREFVAAREFVLAQQGVALDLYRQLASEPGNVVFSPWSLVRALALAHEGAAGETAAELERVLHLPSGGAGEAFAALVLAMRPNDGAPKFEFAASMWGQRGQRFRDEFLVRLKRAYASELFPVDFREPDRVRDAINRWASERTHERIRELVPAGQLTKDTRLVLVDAAYFKAAWREPFGERWTQPAKFLTAAGEVEAATMRQTAYMSYGESELARVVELPCVGGMTMLIVLPKERSAQALANVVERESLAAWTAELRSREVALALPKFRFEFGADCVPPLQRLGVKLALDPDLADFSRIGAGPFFIGAVQHKAFIAVDEQGAEAAAATTVLMPVGCAINSVSPPAPVPFVADHPFLFAIRHNATSAVLFLGRVDDPTRG